MARSTGRRRSRIFVIVACEVAILAGLGIWLGVVNEEGPHRIEARLADGRAVIFYLPEAATNLPATASTQARKIPPVAVLVSGLGASPLTMASLGRRLANNGYAALAIGIPTVDFASPGNAVYQDVAAAVDYARASRWVDGSRVVLIGHSAGAGAVTAYAIRDHAIAGVILISGGCYLEAGDRLSNALFVFTSHDPSDFRDSCRAAVKQLSGTQQPRWTETYGDFHSGTAVSGVEIDGESHVSIVGAKRTASYVVGWMDRVFETQRTGPPDLRDPEGFIADLVLGTMLVISLTLYYYWLSADRRRRRGTSD